MCRKKLVSAVRAATLSVVGMPCRNIDPHTCSTKARSGFACPGVALIGAASSFPRYAPRIYQTPAEYIRLRPTADDHQMPSVLPLLFFCAENQDFRRGQSSRAAAE